MLNKELLWEAFINKVINLCFLQSSWLWLATAYLAVGEHFRGNKRKGDGKLAEHVKTEESTFPQLSEQFENKI